MDILTYNTLPNDALKIRQIVFIKEQGFHNEFDEIDKYAKHIVLYKNNSPVATCRYFKDELTGQYLIGRIAVVKQYRGKNLGSFILKYAETEIEKSGGKCVFLHAQIGAKNFYEKHGYKQCREMDYEESCPHFWMCKMLGGRK